MSCDFGIPPTGPVRVRNALPRLFCSERQISCDKFFRRSFSRPKR